MRSLTIILAVCALLAAPAASLARTHRDHDGRHASAAECSNGKSTDAAMWYSVLHPGVGEWYLNGFGSFNANAPQKKFWLGFIPGYGWPGYLQVKSAIDVKHCRTNDDLSRQHEIREARRRN
jgi:hypothetical protein